MLIAILYENGVVDEFFCNIDSFDIYRDFEKLLESFGWPMRLKTATPTLETHEKLHRSVMNMTKINCTVHEGEGNSSSDISLSDGDLNEVFVPILPIQVYSKLIHTKSIIYSFQRCIEVIFLLFRL